MLKIGDVTSAPEVTTSYTFPLDPFQRIGIHSIQQEENVMVTAKTGSGKTLLAEYQIEYSLLKGKRVFYTTPIKSLSNQKFHDLKQIHGTRVGIMTGDMKFAPQSDIVIMTTEILRNLLFKIGTQTEHIGTTAMLSLDGVDAVVFDEFHYIMDPERGKVWEECLMLLPHHIKLVLLSATIDEPEMFGTWLAEQRKRNLMLVSTQYRVVPLKHCVGLEVVMDHKNIFYKDVYKRYLSNLKQEEDKRRRHKEAVQARQEGEPVVEKDFRQTSFVFRMNETIQMLTQRNLLPALFFVLSRRKCEEYASRVEHALLSHTEVASVRKIVGFHLSRYHELHTMPQYLQLTGMLEKGVAYHHSGLLPLLKEIIELLFSQGLIRILFATETFAVGINMPTKTVIFTSYYKHDRMLRTDEYTQMAGRAGRRGKDTEGVVMYLPDRNPSSLEEVHSMMTGKQPSIESRLNFHYDFLLKCFLRKQEWTDIQNMSFWAYMRNKELRMHEDEIRRLSSIPDIPVAEFQQRLHYETTIKETNNAERKDAQRKLEQWKNKHVGPRWEEGWKQFRIYLEQQQRIAYLTRKIQEIKESSQNPFVQSLERMGYLCNGELTKLGILASEINEGHPLLLSKMYYDGHLKSLSRNELIAYFGCFIEEEESTYAVVPGIQSVVQRTRECALELQMHDTQSPPTYWALHTYWPEILYKWMEGEQLAVLSQHYEVYEGNVVKAILKCSNIADEYINMATIMQDIQTLETLRDIRQDIVRGIVVPDSLYLRL